MVRGRLGVIFMGCSIRLGTAINELGFERKILSVVRRLVKDMREELSAICGVWNRLQCPGFETGEVGSGELGELNFDCHRLLCFGC